MPANLENSAVATGLEKVSFHSNLKERQGQRMFKLLHSIHMLAKECSKFSKLGFNSTWTKNFQTHKLDLEKRQRNQRSNCQHPLDHQKSKGIPEKHLLLLYWLCYNLWLCGSQQTVEQSSRDENIRLPYLPPEKPVCRSRSNRSGHGTTDWVQIEKGVRQGCILSP